ncbi:hypothetical protein EVAR_28422_1 [Eumeta japonica]|uniref:Uncharacterized protein n=1 Tax=Eumeta variegata TaxID=151549 RepID=A0A4C1V9I9_EUMVA|nr:hypothetical protein EVAR_28422_1 [Eumeta japonica]
MIDKWVVLIVALASLHIGCCLPVRQTPYTYPHEAEWNTDGRGEWRGGGGGGAAYALPALALLITAVGLIFGCTWCYRHKDCKRLVSMLQNNDFEVEDKECSGVPKKCEDEKLEDYSIKTDVRC